MNDNFNAQAQHWEDMRIGRHIEDEAQRLLREKIRFGDPYVYLPLPPVYEIFHRESAKYLTISIVDEITKRYKELIEISKTI